VSERLTTPTHESDRPALDLSPLSTRRNFSWALLGNGFYGLCQLGMIAALAKLGDPAMVGQFMLALAICAPVFLLSSLQLRTVQATDARETFSFDEYSALRVRTVSLAFLAVAAIVMGAGYPLTVSLAILGMAAAKALESLSDLYYGLFQQRERLDRVAISLLIKGAVSLAGLAGGVYLTGSVLGAVAGLAAAWAVVLLVYDIPSVRRMRCAAAGTTIERPERLARKAALRKLFLLSLPLGWVALLVSLRVNVPRYFLSGMLGDSALGVFAALAYFMVLGSRVVHCLGQAASSRLAQHWARGDGRGFLRLSLQVSSLCLALGLAALVLAVVLGEEILGLLYGPEYAQEAPVFVILMVAGLCECLSVAFQYLMSAARYLKAQGLLLTISMVVLLVSLSTLVPQHGLKGAALALLASHLVEAAGGLVVMLYVAASALPANEGSRAA
jgi:O-antigen/teichoic acid export membrane protein